MKLAIITSHPIQYYAPVFKMLTERSKIKIKVFYTWGADSISKFDPGFEKKIMWDIPLLDGYDYEFLKNIAIDSGTHHFNGINNPDIIDRINSFSPDAILLYGWGFKSHLKALKHFAKRKTILFRGDSTLLDQTSISKKLLRLLFLKWLYLKVDKAMYVGKANREYFKMAGLKDKQLIFIPHAVDNQRFALKNYNEVKKLRQNLNINDNEILVLFAGNLSKKKIQFYSLRLSYY